eukprot:TRINITY_DN60728_c0_g1_i1.p1 TRINITY_DN60728_c0_g1~~TRINITY_DN60728_c0_g1_i1.p1  ORF type:complete len:691 (+),score=96.62 TRINITY_DN60728_c0_g1_i1:1-2073(+)
MGGENVPPARPAGFGGELGQKNMLIQSTEIDAMLQRIDGLVCKQLGALSGNLRAVVKAAVMDAMGVSQAAKPAVNIPVATGHTEIAQSTSALVPAAGAKQASVVATSDPTLPDFRESNLSETLKFVPMASEVLSLQMEEDEAVTVRRHWTSCVVIPRTSRLGVFLNLLSSVLILYIATLFPYKLCFQDLSPYVSNSVKDSFAWRMFDSVVSALFIFDLCINVFVSYQDKDGLEVFDLRRIAVHYTCQAMFVINVVACVPEGLFTLVVLALAPESDPGNANKSVLILRLQRAARLVRILRLIKLSNLLHSQRVRKLLKGQGPRLAALVVALFWSMHLLGCGWFLVAVLHEDSSQAWVFRRNLESAGPAEQWMTSMYFVLTVFTTVGFGDISASTVSEMIYAGVVMIVGTVLNTVFLGQILEMWSATDLSQMELAEATTSLQGFSEHTHLSEQLSAFLDTYARSMKGQVSIGLSSERARKLFNGPYVSRDFLPQMAEQVFDGALLKHSFLTQLKSSVYAAQLSVPNRLVLFLAAMSVEKRFSRKNILYKKGEMASFLYLVTKGTCAHVHDSVTVSGDWPYQLLNFGKYCGAYEVLHELGTYAATVRCESQGANALALPRKELLELCTNNFPQIFLKLARMAFLHDMSRRRRTQIWTAPRSYKDLACAMIWRHFSARRNRAPDTIRKWPVWPN